MGRKKGWERREEIEGLKRGEGSNRGRWVDEVKGEREKGINKVKEREKKGREREKRGWWEKIIYIFFLSTQISTKIVFTF